MGVLATNAAIEGMRGGAASVMLSCNLKCSTKLVMSAVKRDAPWLLCVSRGHIELPGRVLSYKTRPHGHL
jgi:hypothetical protein